MHVVGSILSNSLMCVFTKIKLSGVDLTMMSKLISINWSLSLNLIYSHAHFPALVLWIVIHNTDSKFYLQNTAVKDILQLNKIKVKY